MNILFLVIFSAGFMYCVYRGINWLDRMFSND